MAKEQIADYTGRLGWLPPVGGVVPILRGPLRGVHSIVCTEYDPPGTYEVWCEGCGEVTWCPWGEAAAEEIARLHLWKVGATSRIVRL